MAESAAFARRGYSGTTAATTLSAGINSSVTTVDGVDLSTWTATITNGPARATISDGTSEEEIEFTGVSGNSLTGVTRGRGGTTAASWSTGATLEHTSSVRDFDEANYWVAELAAAIGAADTLIFGDADNSIGGTVVPASRLIGKKASGALGPLTAAEAKTILAIATGDVSGLGTIPTTAVFYTSHTWTIDPPAVESSDTDFIKPMTVAKASGDTIQIERVEHQINSGTSVTWDLTVNGTGATGFTSLSSTTTTTNTDPTNVTLADRDKVKPDISAVTGTPRNWEVTVTLKHTIALT